MKFFISSPSRIFFFILAFAAVAPVAFAAEPQQENPKGTKKGKNAATQSVAKEKAFTLSNPTVVHRVETYKTIGNVTLKIDLFEPKAKDPNKRYPAIVFFFGGGWKGGTPSQFYHHCEYFAGRGMIAMAADYRVEGRNQTTPAECVQDGKSAVRWIRIHATRLGIDPARIAAGGGSAGGHVAAAVATTTGFEEAGEDRSVSCIPNALVLFNPVYDNGPQGYGYDRVKDLFPAISPLHNLKPGTPPTIVFLGTRDNLIPVATAKEYQTQMRKHGDRSELHLYEDQPHGFFNFRDGATKYYYRTIVETDKFLASLDWIEGDPTIASDLLQ